MTALDRFMTWLAAAESTDNDEIIEHARTVDERLVEPVTEFLTAHPDHFDDAELLAVIRQHLPESEGTGEEKIRVFVNTSIKMSRGKMAAQVAHAVLQASGAHPDFPIVVLGAHPRHIGKLTTVIHDAGKTELEPGTLTAGTDWTPKTKVRDALVTAGGTDTSALPLPEFLEMSRFVSEHPTLMAPAVLSQTIRDLITRLEAATHN